MSSYYLPVYIKFLEKASWHSEKQGEGHSGKIRDTILIV